MPDSDIVIRGAREHNLKNFDIRIPRDTLTVITGVSGSGKSSLAFDTIFAEGQRRYVESLSAYARQFLGRMEKPDVDHIEGLSPSISIDQKGVSKNPRSTVGTVTEIYDYLRLLFSRAGRPHCYNCGRPVERQTVQQIVDSILAIDEGTRLQILAPMVTHMRGEHEHIFETARNDGFVRVRVDGETRDLSDEFKLAKTKWHGAWLRDVLQLTLQPYMQDNNGRIAFDGPDVELPGMLARPMCMVVNELATNAAKHGALSNDAGTVHVMSELNDDHSCVLVTWAESGGPPVKDTGYRGTGTTLLEGLVQHEMRGKINISLAEDGLTCRLEVPLKGSGSA